MPGGSPAAWPHVKPIFQAIAAKADDGTPCCDWVGEDGAGHFVKMVHNGIEYGDMQIICEAYHLMKDGLGMTADEMHEVFAEWNKGELDSYLIEITRDILGYKDEDGQPLVDLILDTAGQKGTGKWTVDRGARPGHAADARSPRRCSPAACRRSRTSASPPRKVLTGPKPKFAGDKQGLRRRPPPGAVRVQDRLLRPGLQADARGGQGVRAGTSTTAASRSMWRGGCIIRSAFLGKIKEAFDREPEPGQPAARPVLPGRGRRGARTRWRRVVVDRGRAGHPGAGVQHRRWPTTTATARERLPANLLQAQRDYFGAHTYERVDKPRGQFFHTNWTGRGGTTSASTYTV